MGQLRRFPGAGDRRTPFEQPGRTPHVEDDYAAPFSFQEEAADHLIAAFLAVRGGLMKMLHVGLGALQGILNQQGKREDRLNGV